MGKKSVVGAVIATAVGVAAGMAALKLSDEKNRKKFGKVVSDLTDKAAKFSRDVDRNSKPVIKQIKKVAEENMK